VCRALLAELRPSRMTQIEVLGVPGELAFYEPTNRHNPRVGGDRRRNVCPAPGSTELGSAPKAVQIDIPLRHQRTELDFGLCHDLQAKIRAFSPNVAQRTRLVMSKVFVSYRHDDSGADAGRLYDTLAAELGQDALYKDVENITIGRNWKRAVREALADSAAVLFVMGPDWGLTPAIEFELQLTLASNVAVVPILVRRGDLIQLTSGLPAPLSEISERKAVTLNHASWLRDCTELVETLKRVLADPARARVLIEPPDPRVLLDEGNWPAVSDRDHLLTYAQDLAECLCDPDVRKEAEASYNRFREQLFDEYYKMHDIPPALLGVVRSGLERLSIEQYVRDLLDRCPSNHDWDALASTAASLGELLGDPSIGERAWNESNEIEEQIAEISRSRGDSGSPDIIRSCQAILNSMVRSAKARLLEEIPGIDRPGFTKTYTTRPWPAKAFGKTKRYGQRWWSIQNDPWIK
jgi:TIR domain